jgi:hypothetical protein
MDDNQWEAPEVNTLSPRLAGAPRVTAAEAAALEQRWWLSCAVFVILVWGASLGIGFRNSLSILTMFGFASAVAGLLYPRVGLLGIVILCLLDAPARVYLFGAGGLLRWNTFNYWLLLVMLLYLPFLVRLRDHHSLTLMWFVGLLIVELTITTGMEDGVQHVLGIIITFGLLVYIARAGYDRHLWFWLAVIAGLIGAGGGLAFYLQRGHIPKINPNAWAAFPVTALFVICLGFHAAGVLKRGQAILMALAGMNFALTFLSGSRGNMLIGACCMITLFFAMRGVRQRTVAVLSVVVAMMVVIAHFGKMEAVAIHRITKLVTTDEPLSGDYSLSGRTSGRSDLALGGLYIFEEHPFGVGTGGFPVAWRDLDRHDGLGDYARGLKREAHSAWIKTLAENGIPGIFLFTAYVFSFALVGLRKGSRNLKRLGLLTTIALSVAFLSTEFQGKGLWLLAAATTAFLQRESVTMAMFGRRRRVAGNASEPEPSTAVALVDQR